MLEPLVTLCVSFFFFSYIYYISYICIAHNISISMYIMCVILCLFSALSCGVGTLQISIIVIWGWGGGGGGVLKREWKHTHKGKEPDLAVPESNCVLL